jgi:hypothetical protein
MKSVKSNRNDTKNVTDDDEGMEMSADFSNVAMINLHSRAVRAGMTAKKAVDILREADLVICGVKPSMRSFP